MITRREFTWAALAAPRPLKRSAEKVFLKSWEAVDLATLYFRPGRATVSKALRITAANGAFGIMPARFCQEFSPKTLEILRTHDLLNHAELFAALSGAGVPAAELKSADLLAWDLHARMEKLPLHALLGTRRTRILRYGDVRGQQPGFDPQQYADKVARYLEETGMRATKLHFPGAMGTGDSIEFVMVLDTLKRIRQTTGPRPMLAWDPYPASAESATRSMAEAREIIALMESLNYAWIEGPLPPVPEAGQIPKYQELVRTSKLVIQAEGQGPVGDGTAPEAIRRWVEAGAVTQFSTDCYIREGVTPLIETLDWARRQRARKVRANLHWSWVPHLHLAMAYDEEFMPVLEFPMAQEVPPEYFEGSEFVKAPDWPGIYLYKGKG